MVYYYKKSQMVFTRFRI